MIMLICCVENAIVVDDTDDESEEVADDDNGDMNIDTVINELMELRAKIDSIIMKLR